MNAVSVCKHLGGCAAVAVLFMTVKPLFGARPLLAFSHGDGGQRHAVTLERNETAGAVELFAQVDAMTVRLRRRAKSMNTWAFEPPQPVPEFQPESAEASVAPVPVAAPKTPLPPVNPPRAAKDEPAPKKTVLEKIFSQKDRPNHESIEKTGVPSSPKSSPTAEVHPSVIVPGAVPVSDPEANDTFVLWYSGRPYRFNRSGQPIVNRKLLRDDDREVLARLAVFFGSVRWRLPTDVRPRFDGRHRALIPGTAPVFAGFEDDRYQEHDEIIERCCREFNRDRARWVGANPNAVLNIPSLSPALVKSLMIEESGGGDIKSREAWAVDPMQVNVPGDWSEAKAELGLPKPTARNEGTPERNIRAGIKFLARKGFGVSGRSVGNRPKAYFDSWRTALHRYNGRVDVRGDGRTFRAAYADRIRRRAEHPTREVPIGSN